MTDKIPAWIADGYAEALQALEQNRPNKAEGLARSILAAFPQHGGAMTLLAMSALAQGRAEESAAWAKACLSLTPDDGQSLYILGMAQKALADLPGAADSLTRAAANLPNRADIRINLANLKQDMGDFEGGLAQYRLAVDLEPENAQLRYNLGLSLLTLGRFEEGWRESEWRWKAAGLDLAGVDFKAPAWMGEDMSGKTLLLWAEQGMGDSIMCCRYVPLLAARGVRVLLQAPRSLLSLFSSLEGLAGLAHDRLTPSHPSDAELNVNRSLKQIGRADSRPQSKPEDGFVFRRSALFAEGEPLPPFDAQAPLLAVPGRLGTTLATIPGQVPYLQAPKERRIYWRQKLAETKGFKVGLVWRGNPHHANDAARSIPPQLLRPLLDVPGISWIALQPDPGSDPGSDPLPIPNAGPDLTDWGDTAGLVSNLDLLIAVDTSTAHLAGALGIPCWLMLPFMPDWRWMLKRSDSPWYPTITLFRQESPGGWDGVVRRLASALRQILR